MLVLFPLLLGRWGEGEEDVKVCGGVSFKICNLHLSSMAYTEGN